MVHQKFQMETSRGFMHDFDDLCIAFGDGDTGENTENRASASVHQVDAWI